MKNLMAVYGAAIVFLVVVTGYLWSEVRADRQLIAELQSQAVAQPAPRAEPAQVPVIQPTVDAQPSTPAKASNLPTPPPAMAVPPTPPPAPPTINTVRVSGVEVSLRAAAMADADQTATQRVLAWRDRLAIAGQTLTTPQMQALDVATRAELRREAEDALERSRNAVAPTDAEGAFRLREENLVRQNDANMRILDAVTTQLGAEQVRALRTQFESGHASRMASLKAEREAAAQGR
jgi:hypothetical protein